MFLKPLFRNCGSRDSFRMSGSQSSKVVSDSVFLDIFLQERPRISSVKYNGMKKSEQDDLVEKLNLPVGSQITEYLLT